MPAEPVCNVCRDSRSRDLAAFRSDLDGEFYHVMKCTRCGLLYLHPLPVLTPSRLKEVYGKEYAETVYPDPQTAMLDAALHRQMEIVEQYGKKGVALNVGAMLGDVRILLDRGWRLHSVEPSAYAAARAQKNWGLEVTVSRIEDYSCPPESYDLIRLSHVIEHLVDPAATLEKLRSMLRKGGLILIDTDNGDGLETRTEAMLMGLMRVKPLRLIAEAITGKKYHLRYGRLTPPVHLYTFTMKGLKSLLEQKGFEVIKTLNTSWGDPTWFPLSPRSFLEMAFARLDQLGAKFGRGNVIAVIARRPE